MARPLTQIIEQRNNSIPPHRPFHGMWGGRMTSCVGQCHKKSRGQTFHLCNFCFCDYCLIFLCAGGGGGGETIALKRMALSQTS